MNPKQKCTICGRIRDCSSHLRAEHPPTAAKKWLKKTCPETGKPCEFQYTAGIEFKGPFIGQ
jgi:hypothetical protein